MPDSHPSGPSSFAAPAAKLVPAITKAAAALPGCSGVAATEAPDDGFYRAVYESSRDCIKTLSLDGTLLSIADASRELLCVDDLAALIGRSWYEFWNDEDRDAARAAVATAASGGHGRFVGRFKVSGETRWWDVLVTPLRDRHGSASRLLAVSRDVTDRHRLEEGWRNEAEQLAAFVESATIGLHRLGPDGTILWANRAELDTLGYTADEYIGQNLARFHARPETIDDILARLSRGERLRDYPAQLRHKDGSLRDVLIDSCVRWENGRFVHTQCFTRDVTRAAREQEATRRLAAIVEHSDDAIIATDLEERVVSWNGGAERMFGYPAAEVLGRAVRFLHPGAPAVHEASILERLRSGERVHHFESVRRTRGGELIDVSISASALHDAAGRIAGMAKIVRNISERKAAERALLAARQEYQRTLERLHFSLGSLRLGDWHWNAATDEIVISPRTAEIYGVPPNLRLTREKMREALHPDDRERARAAAREAVAGKCDYNIEYRVNHPVRGLCWVEASGRPVCDDAGNVTGMLGVVQDITGRKNAEIHLRHQRDVLEQIVRAAALPDILERLARWVEGAIQRRSVAALMLVSDDGQSLRAAAGPTCPRTWLQAVDGIRIADGMGSCGTAAHRREPVITHDLAADDRWASLKAVALEHGFRACWSTPILATDGGVLGTFAIYYPEPTAPAETEREIVDVVTRTAAIAIERKRSEEALRESQEKLQQHAEALEHRVAERTAKLRETIGELEAFSYSVSHDMRAPLRAMQGYSERLLTLHGEHLDTEGRHYLDRINKNSQRLELLVRDVLAYSKVAKSEIELFPMDLDAFVNAIITQVPEVQNDEVTLTLKRPFPLVLGHEAYLSQIFTNLLGNAVKFSAPGRRAQITISAQADQQWVTVSVRDNGIGIAREHFDRIFEIFGRVYPDRQYEGTGIGLAIVKKAVQRMGGSITVESEVGQGTCFSFTLQRA